MDNQTQPKKILSSRQLSLLSHEELVSQLLAAQEKIQELEAKQHVHNKGSNANANGETLLNENVSRNPKIGKSQAESIFAYTENNSTESLSDSDSPYQDRSEVIKELQEKLQNGKLEENWLKAVSHHNSADEDFIVAYECKGNFPYCDEDLATPSLSADEEGDIERPKIIINDGLWEDDECECSEIDEIETFPLIPSPVLNTPPYEYIFLTKTNEAKYRIFLNQKLNKVFQEEILKLKIHEEQMLQEQSQVVYEGEENDSVVLEQRDTAEKEMEHTNHMDLHNQNHIVNCSSINEVTNNLSSTCNVIHCFDPSDVDLDLKKIFMEKPPITHKIVRRKSRRDRGSSVPAVDSYYGTKDLNKVGHASYFIPTLTESERKAIGWKHEYHYGHWKYATLNVPNPKTNQISLHPHVEGDGTNHNHNNHNGTLPHNPLHHHEIDISEASNSLNDSGIVPPPQSKLCSKHQHQHPCNHGAIGNANGDTLSFITLSGCSREASQSCHIIPDKGTLRKILQWLLPCIKQTAKSTTANVNATAVPDGQNNDQAHSTGTTVEEQKSKEKTYHEIETLVEPSKKLIFQISNTNMSFIDAGASGSEEKAHDIANQNRPMTSENDKVHVHTLLDSEKGESLENHHHHHTHSHHHHHGIFHWKNILAHHNHGHSEESMSVVGGDVVESMHDAIKGTDEGLDVIHIEMNESSPQTEALLQELVGEFVCNDDAGRHGFSDCTSDSESENEHGGKESKSFRKLKPCKAFFKLLTLKDIGYESDENGDLGETDNSHEDKDGPGRGGNSSYPENMKDISSASSRQEFICRNKRCDELSNRAYKPLKSGESGRAHRHGERCVTANRITSWSSDLTGNDYDDGDLSSGGSAYPFSSLSVSHQNSIVGSNILDSESLTLPEQRTSEEMVEVETRFLDPKDSLTPRKGRPLKNELTELVVEGQALPFVYDIDNTTDEQQDDVKEWIGGDYMEEIEEGLGLLSSCLESIMKHDAIVNAVNEGHHVPDKVEGQHKITTLNDLENKRDGNKNY